MLVSRLTTSASRGRFEHVIGNICKTYAYCIFHCSCGNHRVLFSQSFVKTSTKSFSTTTTMSASGTDFVFRQLFDRKSCTYTYVLGDRASKRALLIDPVLELVDRDLQLVNELGLKLQYVINTHVHADHITGSGKIKDVFNTGTASTEAAVKSVISKESGAKADIHVTEGDTIAVGENVVLNVLNTPGHTNGCLSYVDHNNAMVFTGDALLIRGCGRTDFQSGDAGRLYDSVHGKLFTLPDHYKVYPAHDYKGQLVSTIAEEKQFNPRLTKSKEQFIELMNNLNLAYPEMIDVAVPRNMICGYND